MPVFVIEKQCVYFFIINIFENVYRVLALIYML